MSVEPGRASPGPDRVVDPAVVSPRRAARTAARDLLAAAPGRRGSDWDARPLTHEDDLGWAAKRAAVTIAAAMLQACDDGTATHCDDVVHLCDLIADELGVYGNDRAELLAAAQLHDIGKVAIAADVLNKPGALDDHEWRLIRRHTVVGERIIRSVSPLEEVGRLVRHSHERWDGGGYPDGLSGAEIPLASRIIFCADTFHAIRSDRPYRRGRSAHDALEEIARIAGSQLDSEIADALINAAERLRTAVGSGAGGLITTLRSRRLVELLVTRAPQAKPASASRPVASA
jgi:HD-GYP domain-containing protein (c-di-GMP phosphodiesterase class II)